jgi:hypothetical protein
MTIQAKWLRLIILLLIVNWAEAVNAQQSPSDLDAYVVLVDEGKLSCDDPVYERLKGLRCRTGTCRKRCAFAIAASSKQAEWAKAT